MNNKKTLLHIIIYILIFTMPAYSQRFQGGFVVGVAGSQIDGDNFSGYNKVGLELGSFADYKISDKCSLRSGVYLVQKGAHSSANMPYFKTVVNEVEVPLWFNYYPYHRFGGTLGLSFAYIYRVYYHSSYYLDREDLGIGVWDFTTYLSFNYRLNSFLTLRASYRYGLLPITRPIKRECWKKSIYFFWLTPYPSTAGVCWWTNTASFSLEVKIPAKK